MLEICEVIINSKKCQLLDSKIKNTKDDIVMKSIEKPDGGIAVLIGIDDNVTLFETESNTELAKINFVEINLSQQSKQQLVKLVRSCKIYLNYISVFTDQLPWTLRIINSTTELQSRTPKIIELEQHLSQLDQQL